MEIFQSHRIFVSVRNPIAVFVQKRSLELLLIDCNLIAGPFSSKNTSNKRTFWNILRFLVRSFWLLLVSFSPFVVKFLFTRTVTQYMSDRATAVTISRQLIITSSIRFLVLIIRGKICTWNNFPFRHGNDFNCTDFFCHQQIWLGVLLILRLIELACGCKGNTVVVII